VPNYFEAFVKFEFPLQRSSLPMKLQQRTEHKMQKLLNSILQ